jgi:hypothetical protein
MVNLLHEVWEDYDENGQSLPGCCLAGPDGGDFRRLLGPRARLIHTFESGSHYEAMTIYNRLLGRGAYTTDHPWDMQPYHAEWATRQGPPQQ